MLVVNRFELTEAQTEQFQQDAKAALSALSACRGFVRGRCGAGLDSPSTWTLVTEWETVGAYRRALSSFDVKMYGTPLLSRALPEASAFEVSLAADGTELSEYASDRAPGMGRREIEPPDHDPETTR
jgi:hypothetical protein